MGIDSPSSDLGAETDLSADLALPSDLSATVAADLSRVPPDIATTDGPVDGGGDGSLSFVKTASFGAGTSPWGVVAADFNRDNNLDVAVTNFGATTVSILLGDGKGSFGAPKDTTVGPQPTAIASADFNNDGIADLVVGSGVPSKLPGTWTSAVYGLIGNGDGTFSVHTYNFFGGQLGCPAVAVADFTNDTRPDVMFLCSGPSYNPGLVFFPDTANGIFGTADVSAGVAATNDRQSDALALAAADFNDDNNQDVVTRDKLFLGNGDGTLQTPTTTVLSIRTGVATADFDGNGTLDVGFSDQFQVGVAKGDDMGGFGAPTPYAVGMVPQGMAVGDFNADGKLDIVVANYSSHYVTVLLGNGDGTFPVTINIDVASNDTPTSVAVGDFNRDGRPDIVVADQVAVQILLNTSH